MIDEESFFSFFFLFSFFSIFSSFFPLLILPFLPSYHLSPSFLGVQTSPIPPPPSPEKKTNSTNMVVFDFGVDEDVEQPLERRKRQKTGSLEGTAQRQGTRSKEDSVDIESMVFLLCGLIFSTDFTTVLPPFYPLFTLLSSMLRRIGRLLMATCIPFADIRSPSGILRQGKKLWSCGCRETI